MYKKLVSKLTPKKQYTKLLILKLLGKNRSKSKDKMKSLLHSDEEDEYYLPNTDDEDINTDNSNNHTTETKESNQNIMVIDEHNKTLEENQNNEDQIQITSNSRP